MKNLNIKNAARGLLGTKRKCWLLALMLLAATLPAAGMPWEAYAEEMETESEAVQPEELETQAVSEAVQTEEPEAESKVAQTKESASEESSYIDEEIDGAIVTITSEPVDPKNSDRETEGTAGENISFENTSPSSNVKPVKQNNSKLGKLSVALIGTLQNVSRPKTIAAGANNLTDFVGEAQLARNGKVIESGDTTLLVSENYTYQVQFTESDGNKFESGEMTFSLPSDHITYTEVTDQLFKDEDGTEAGTYSVSKDGVVTVKFTDTYLRKNGEKKPALGIDFTVEDDEVKISFPGISQIFSSDVLDLNPFITEAHLSQDGHNIEDDDKVEVGEHYRYSVKFEEGQFGEGFLEKMEFQLPGNVKCNPQERVPFYEEEDSEEWKYPDDDLEHKGERRPAGWYSVDENGLVTFEFDPEYLEKRGNKKLGFNLDVAVTDVDDKGRIEFPWEGGGKQSFVVDTATDVTLTKTGGDYLPKDPDGPCVEYTVELKVENGAVKNPKIEDTIVSGLSYREDSYEITVYDEKENQIEFPEGAGPKLVKKADGSWWEIEGLPDEMLEGQRVVIKYKCNVDFEDARVEGGSLKLTAENDVNFTGDIPGSEDPLTKHDNEKKYITDTRLKKSGSKDSTNPDDLDWEIEIGSGSTDVRGCTVKDTLEKNGDNWDQWINEKRPLEIKWKNGSGSTVRTYYIPWEDAAKYGLTLEPKWDDSHTKIIGFDLKIPEEGKELSKELLSESDKTNNKDTKFWEFTDETGTTRLWQPGDWIKVEYYTTHGTLSDEQIKDGVTFGNGASIEGEPELGVQGEVTIGVSSISKDVVREGDYLLYTVNIDIPNKEGLINALGSSKDVEDEHGVRFYLQDKLWFDSVKYEKEDGTQGTESYYVDNNPVVDSIEAKQFDEDGETVVKRETFTENATEAQSFCVRHSGTDYTDEADGLLKGRWEFQIWFNTFYKENPDKYDSRWTLEEAYTLTVTYRIPVNAKLVRERPKDAGKENCEETNMTVQDLLEQGYTLSNKVEAIGREKRISTTRKYTEPQNEHDVLKRAELKTLTDGRQVIEYRVAFNGFNLNASTGKYEEIAIAPEQFKLVDTYDSQLSYVEGSLYVDVYAPDSHRFRYRFGYQESDVEKPTSPEINVGEETTTLTAEAMRFNKRLNEGDGEKKELEEGKEIDKSLQEYMTKSSGVAKSMDALYIFVYQLELKNESMKAEEIILHNDALVYYGGPGPSGDSADVSITPNVLKKEGLQKDSGGTAFMEYVVEANPGGIDMVTTDNPEVNPGRYTLIDEMDSILEMDIESVEVYRVEKNEGGGETEVKLNMVSDPALVTAGGDNYVFKEDENNTFKFTLPDEEYIRIKYKTKLNAELGSEGKVTNTVSMENNTVIGTKKTADYEMQSSDASVSGDIKLRLYKEDAATGIRIGGAEFQVYTIKREGDTGEELKVKIGEKEYSFIKYGDPVVPDALKGKQISQKADYYKKDNENYYLLLETKAPEGYKLNSTPVIIKFGDPPKDAEGKVTEEKVTVEYNEEEYENVIVQYIHKGDNVIIFKDDQEAYELPETGGFGSMMYTLAGLLLIFSGAFCLMYRKNNIQKGGW